MRIRCEEASAELFAKQDIIVAESPDGTFSFQLYGHRSLASGRAYGAAAKTLNVLEVEIEDPTDENTIRELLELVVEAKGTKAYLPELIEEDLWRYRSMAAPV